MDRKESMSESELWQIVKQKKKSDWSVGLRRLMDGKYWIELEGLTDAEILALINYQPEGEKCPDCGGSGKKKRECSNCDWRYGCEYRDNYHEDKCDFKDSCSTCHGTGYLPVKLVRLAEDQAIDIPDDVFFSPEAKRCGFTKRSFREAGWRKVNPDDLEVIK